jgi:hypothetical protein
MEKWKKNSEVKTDGECVEETDAIGRERFWEDIGRPDEK